MFIRAILYRLRITNNQEYKFFGMQIFLRNCKNTLRRHRLYIFPVILPVIVRPSGVIIFGKRVYYRFFTAEGIDNIADKTCLGVVHRLLVALFGANTIKLVPKAPVSCLVWNQARNVPG